MRSSSFILFSCLVSLVFLQACTGGKKGTHADVVITADAKDLQKTAQNALLNLKSGDTLTFGEGTFEFTASLSLDTTSGVVIRGAGKDKTILSFKGQTSGAEGILAKANRITIQDLTLRDSKGDGIKVQDANGIIFRRLHITWTGENDSTNGAYGLYPVTSRNVLIEDCEVTNCMDAGIYLGQSTNGIVRRNNIHANVCGIEIENSSNVEVYENQAYDNTGGILIFDLPKLIKPSGGHVRVYNNKVKSNNRPNFSPKGVIAAEVPAGTGIMVMSVSEVEIYNNEIVDHNTAGTIVNSYKMLEAMSPKYAIKEKKYNPFPSAISIHDNTYGPATGATDTRTYFGQAITQAFKGKKVPEILTDGIVNPADMADEKRRICIRNNKNASFANLMAGKGVSTDSKPYDCSIPALSESTLGN